MCADSAQYCANSGSLYSLITQYGIIGAILLLDVNTSCLPEVGGSGCE
jgi:hypothetical protein